MSRMSDGRERTVGRMVSRRSGGWEGAMGGMVSRRSGGWGGESPLKVVDESHRTLRL